MLEDAVSTLKGVTPKRTEALASLGIQTVGDLLFYFPFRYDDVRVKSLLEISDQEKVTLEGTVVVDPVVAYFGGRKSRVTVRLRVEEAVILVSFFNQPWLKDRFVAGESVAVYGKWDAKKRSLLGMKILPQAAETPSGLSAIYPVNKSLRQTTLVKLIQAAYAQEKGHIPDVVPPALRQRYRLLSDEEIIVGMHFPTNKLMADTAKRSAIFREFFLFEAQIQSLRDENAAPANGLQIDYDNRLLKAFIQTLPFELTAAQKRVVNEICRDLKSPRHMNRLLQGDVGSGKTIVAAIVLYAAMTAHFQTALMVPTEVLAEQHYQKLAKLFASLPVRVALLTGSTAGEQRRQVIEGLYNGTIDLVIGTHALIQKAVDYRALGLVVIDEQHRFGVNQRRILQEKGLKPDFLAMTATPIPRTLAITTYGEMDVSSIDELPAGRQPITTTWLRKNQHGPLDARVEKELAAGHQVFAITPLIAESEMVDLQNAEALYERLKAQYGDRYQVALLHGQMKSDEKDAIMRSFSANEIQLLVSTTVIEVGIDVPNATVMLIYDADRFGLAQLHQLRGRVGRGDAPAYCMLIADPKNETGVARMETMVDTSDGFVLAEKDLEMRGSGEIFGDRQSGLPEFQLADPVANIATLDAARDAAAEMFAEDATLSAPEYAGLRAYLARQQQNRRALD